MLASTGPLTVMTGAYFDESESEGCFSVAGYLGSYRTWVHLDWLWQDLLTKWRLDYFKASECNNGTKQFAQYRDDPSLPQKRLKDHEHAKLREIMTDFVGAVCKVHDELCGIGAVVVLDDFNRLVSESDKARRLFTTKPYYLCMQLCLVAAAIPIRNMRCRTRSGDDWVRPIFDSHREFSKHTVALFAKFSKKNPESAKVLMQPAYKDDVDVRPLQVADLVAHEVTKLLGRKLANRPERPPMTRLLPSMGKIYKCDYEALKILLDVQSADFIGVQPAIKDGLLNVAHEVNT